MPQLDRRTVKQHTHNIYQKLNAKARWQAVTKAASIRFEMRMGQSTQWNPEAGRRRLGEPRFAQYIEVPVDTLPGAIFAPIPEVCVYWTSSENLG